MELREASEINATENAKTGNYDTGAYQEGSGSLPFGA